MIARAARGQPWLLAQIIAYLRDGSILPTPSFTEIGKALIAQYDDMLAHYGSELGNRIARKHIGWTLSRFEKGRDMSGNINLMHDPLAVRRSLTQFFGLGEMT